MLKEGESPPPPEPEPPAAEPVITYNQPILADALQSPGLHLDLEDSSASWRDPNTRSLYKFQDLTVSWTDLVGLFPSLGAALEVSDGGTGDHLPKPPQRKRGRKEEHHWDAMQQHLLHLLLNSLVPADVLKNHSGRNGLADILIEWHFAKYGYAPENETVCDKLRLWIKPIS
jgi:hypothetical protein